MVIIACVTLMVNFLVAEWQTGNLILVQPDTITRISTLSEYYVET